MRIIAIEKTEEALAFLKGEIAQAFPQSRCDGFLDPLLAIQSYTREPAELTVFSMDMRIIDGFTYTRTVRNINRTFTGIVLLNKKEQLADALNYQLQGLVKPFTERELKDAWEKIRVLQ
jgi:DNA-binding response OmpR family regulator